MLFEPKKKIVINKDLMEAPNLTNRFDEQELDALGQVVWQGYDRDLRSRNAWERRMNAGMDLALQISTDKSFPWPNCANVVFPLVTIAALQFSARSYSNIVQGTDVVKYRVIGTDDDGKLTERAERISRHMSWQVLEEDMDWEEQHDKLLINLAIVGTAFTKSSYSASKRVVTSELVIARDFVLDYFAKSVEGCARKTQVIPLYQNEIHERIMRDTFHDRRKEGWFNTPPSYQPANVQASDERKGVSSPGSSEESSAYRTLEQHRFLDLDKDGYAEPYIVTIEESSRKVLRVVARFEREEDIERRPNKEIISIRPTEYYTKFPFIPSPDGGIYDIGFGSLLGPLNEAVNTGINQLLDSGTMQNSLGGFLGRGAKIRGGVYTMAPWEWKRVDSSGDDLRKNLVPFPDRQPSAVMFNLLGFIVEYVNRAAGTTDPVVGINPGQNTPAETSRNMIEQGTQVYNTVFKRVWRALKNEFKLRHQLNGLFLPVEKKFGTTGNNYIRAEDYRTNPDLVVPAADPNVTSDTMRIQKAGAIAERAQMIPGYDIPVVERNLLKAMRIEGADKFYPGPGKVPPLPNPKAQIEEMKMKMKMLDFQHQKQMLILTLMGEREKKDAEIMKLRADAVKSLAGVQSDKAAQALAAFDSIVDAYFRHQELTMQALAGGEESGEGGGMEGVAAAPGDTGLPQRPAEVAAGSNGAMGGGPVSD